MIFGYNAEQLGKITSCLNSLELKGRQNFQLVEVIFKILEEGVSIEIPKEEDGE